MRCSFARSKTTARWRAWPPEEKMMYLTKLIFGIYPYIALTVFVIGSWIRFDNEQYT